MDPSPLRDVLPGVLKGLRPKRGGVLDKARAAWPEVVGPKAASRTRIVALEGGILKVEVASAALKHHLGTFRGEEVLSGLKKRLGAAALKGVQYRVGALS